jgi:hypothetical protein
MSASCRRIELFGRVIGRVGGILFPVFPAPLLGCTGIAPIVTESFSVPAATNTIYAGIGPEK